MSIFKEKLVEHFTDCLELQKDIEATLREETKKITLSDGGSRFCIFLDDFTPTDKQIDGLFEIDGVEEVGSEGYRDYKVVFHLNSIPELTAERVEKAKRDIFAVLGQPLESAATVDQIPLPVRNTAVSFGD